MTPFQQAFTPPEERDRIYQDFMRQCLANSEFAKKHFGTDDHCELKTRIIALVDHETGHPVFRNDVYQVSTRLVASGEWPELIVLSIKRIDKGDNIPWRDMQQIKNLILGPEFEGVELFPAESRLVDSANQRWMFCLSSDKIRFPFGFNERFVDDGSIAGSKNKPFEEKPCSTNSSPS